MVQRLPARTHSRFEVEVVRAFVQGVAEHEIDEGVADVAQEGGERVRCELCAEPGGRVAPARRDRAESRGN